LPYIIAAHGAKYVATASVSNLFDLKNKVQKALKTDGPSFISVFVLCIPGWKIDSSIVIDLSRIAQDTTVYPLYEIENGVMKLNYTPAEKKPVEQYLMMQGRFKHLTPDLVEKIQKYVDERWKYLEESNGKKIFDTLF
jgi:pyruvate/2-oxoacid:ferredoxin oxidoreductase beta subunit